VSEENVEVVRDIYERWREGDFRTTVDAFDPLVLFVMRREFPDAGTYLGQERLAEYTRRFLEPWSRITIEAEDTPRRGTAWLWPYVSAESGKEAAPPLSSATSRCGPSGAAR